MGFLKETSDWLEGVNGGFIGAGSIAYQKDIDDDTLDEYVLRNNQIFLAFERWGGRLIKAFVFNKSRTDILEVIGVPVSNQASESEEEWGDYHAVSAIRDHQHWVGRT